MMAAQPSPVFDNTTLWHNFTTWTSQRLGYAVNISKLTPSIEDLFKAGPRMVMKLGRIGGSIISFDAIDGFGQRIISESTEGGIFHTTGTIAGSLHAETTTPGALPSLVAEQDPNAFLARLTDGARGFGSVFSYATSKWALACVIMAVILNRTLIFAATRRRLRLAWPVRLALRIVPILLLVAQGRQLLRSIQCQTSPDFAELRWGNASKSSELMFSHHDSFLHGLSSTLLLGATDEESCIAVQMTPAPGEESATNLRGSLSRLWPLFGTVSMSRFVETLSCAVQGRPVASETAMTLFEHSLAFAEADAAISNQLGWGLFANASSTNGKIMLGNNIAVTRSMIMRRVNTSPEVLLVGFFSAMGHLTSHILAIFNLQAKFRLLSTGFFALCFMGSMVWSALNFSLGDASTQSLLRYPTVVIVGYLPHVLIFSGILVCCSIYSLALAVSASATPSVSADGRRLSIRERLAVAHANMQANISLKSDVRIRMDMDFYTALLRAGFAAITMASEAVYLNEDSQVNLKPYTWLEDERLREVEQLQMQWTDAGVPGSPFGSGGTIGLVPVKVGEAGATSGYAREKAAQELSNKAAGTSRRVRAGVGAAERTSRWLVAVEYLMHINRLLMTLWALSTLKTLAFIGVRNPPRLLRWLAQRPKPEKPVVNKGGNLRRERDNARTEWMAAPNGGGRPIPRVERVDVEAEVRRWFGSDDNPARRLPVAEDAVDGMLYSWWAKGGWWGSADASGDYLPPPHVDDEGVDDPDFDTTSVISTTETDASGWDLDDGWDDEPDEGQRTPTQRSPHRGMTPNPFASRESTPIVDNPLDPQDLARLLHPTSPEEREEARALAAHLRSDRILTRSAYRRLEQQKRIQVLGPRHVRDKMTPEEEATVLEQILLSRRAVTASAGADGEGSWATGAAGMGPDGPQCVVCQSAARTIIVWPCRCLSLCDDCRVSLAMNNFDKCVCCRREVVSFSRIFVP